jgi:hypothetical protein
MVIDLLSRCRVGCSMGVGMAPSHTLRIPAVWLRSRQR